MSTSGSTSHVQTQPLVSASVPAAWVHPAEGNVAEDVHREREGDHFECGEEQGADSKQGGAAGEEA